MKVLHQDRTPTSKYDGFKYEPLRRRIAKHAHDAATSALWTDPARGAVRSPELFRDAHFADSVAPRTARFRTHCIPYDSPKDLRKGLVKGILGLEYHVFLPDGDQFGRREAVLRRQVEHLRRPLRMTSFQRTS